MSDALMGLYTFERIAADAAKFVQFWARSYTDPDDEYIPNIGEPLTAERLKVLFKWKIGSRFFDHHWPTIEKKFLARLNEAIALPEDVSAADALATFHEGGVVYRVFWLHCIRPKRFPIFDQHVYRAMNLIEARCHRELGDLSTKAQVDAYVNRYLPFWSSRFSGLDTREVDRALWGFGKFINEQKMTAFSQM